MADSDSADAGGPADSAPPATPPPQGAGGVPVGAGGDGNAAATPARLVYGRVLPPDAPLRTLDDLVAETAADFAPFVEVGDNEHLQSAVASAAEDVNHSLARLEEFHGVVNQISGETDAFLRESVPVLRGNCEQLRATYDRITQLEAFIGLVKRNVQQMEDQVTAVEREFTLQPLRAAKTAITGKLSSLLKLSSTGSSTGAEPDLPGGGGSPATPRKAGAAPPGIFRSADYFVKPEGGAGAVADPDDVPVPDAAAAVE